MRTKLLFFTIFFLLIKLSLIAQIKKEDFLTYGLGFINSQNLNIENNVKPASVFELKDENNSVISYVVNLKPKGFIVFSTSKNLIPVISYSTESNFNYKISKENILLEMIKNNAKKELNILSKKINVKKKKQALLNNKSWEKLKQASSKVAAKASAKSNLIQYGAHLSSIWGGVNCYNDSGNGINVGNYYTPNNYSPGCVATSLSMILHYYKWPETGVGSHTNYDTSGSSQTSWTANFASANYNWDDMLNEYYGVSSTLTQQQAMGYISFHTATSLDMDYESSGSTSNIDRIPSAIGSYFRASGHHQYSSWSNFWSRMHENLENGHPIPIAIDASSGVGHAPVVDGYRYNEGDPESEFYYHLNMGWYGTSNAWYRLQGSFSAGGYTSVSAAVFDLLPEPAFVESNITATSKTFILNWKTSEKINWDAFELQESTDGGYSYSTISNNITDTTYTRTVSSAGTYKYRVRSKVDGNYYANSYSEPIEVVVPFEYIYLDFDGNDSFFVYENSNNDFDISNTYTIETWINIDSRTSGTYPIILDRRTVFSMFLIADSNADYAVKFVSRDSSGNINASLQSDNSTENLSYGDWAHIAVSRTGNTTKLFINGNLIATSTDSDFSLSASSNALNIGARYWGSYSRYLDGKIDKIRITDNAVYTSNFTPDLKEEYIADGNTRILLALDEGTGINLTDGAGNFNTVQLRSSPNQPNWISSDDILESKTLNVATEVKLNKVKLYPVPSTNTLFCFLDNTLLEEVKKITIYNYLGKSLEPNTIFFEKQNNRIAIDVSNFKNGYYVIQFETKTKLIKSKFIKK
ncbi:hypothetical protein BW723_00315 [Polaribacter reichenbachii]|uniref:Uncharacterized protein n=2 Tax=Polaribacter reichenbachii TaxID=996801 RepID=A0A1B8U4M4_9FLAO|nr:C10 family peptidase [Polaribacter reichenbachii]APZ44824.1 hypothetical protein BW723_00315 [Polaribacter reichenbachii]OBY66801.1 hypothetical protein LPB301_05065 [Polaribacter reichenbachii]